MATFLTRAALAACVSAGVASYAAHAQELASTPLTLTEAIERTLASHPQLERFQFELRVAAADEAQAALTPPLELGVDVEDAFGTGRTRGFKSAETTVALSQVLELGGQRAARTGVASAATSAVEVERAAAQLDVLAEVTRRFLHVAADQAHLTLTQDATALAARTAAAAQERLTAGRAPEAELRRANVALARAEIEREHAEHELLASRKQLAAVWGEPEPAFPSVAADLYALPATEPFESLLARVERNPHFARFTSAARIQDAELRLAATQARPRFALRTGLKRLDAIGDTALVLGVSVPLRGSARAQPAIGAAAARRAAADVDLRAHRIRVEAQLYELYQELQHSISEAEVLRAAVIPEMRSALAATEEAFERGRYGYVELADAQRELIDVQRALIEAATNAHVYRAEIERLTAEPLGAVN